MLGGSGLQGIGELTLALAVLRYACNGEVTCKETCLCAEAVGILAFVLGGVVLADGVVKTTADVACGYRCPFVTIEFQCCLEVLFIHIEDFTVADALNLLTAFCTDLVEDNLCCS